MDNQSLLSRFLEEEKNTKPSALLEDRIMAQIDRIPTVSVRPSRLSIGIKATAIAACAVIVIAIGIRTGKSYPIPAAVSLSWNINDSEIENLALYEIEMSEK